MSICITLPFPISANRYWRMARGRIYVSAEATAYKTEVGWLCRIARTEPTDRPVRLTVRAFCPQINNDLDNVSKVLIDSLKGFLFTDDVQIQELHLYRHQANLETAHVDVEMEEL